MNVLAIDIGGTNVKFLASGQSEARKFPSGTTLTPAMMVEGIRKLAGDWKYDVVAMGYPGPVVRDRPMAEPHNLARGWVEFDFAKAFEREVRIINDAAMQALGSYNGGRLLFLGLGTGLGTTLVIEGVVEPMELAHLPYRKATYEDYVGLRALEKFGKKKWRKHVHDVVEKLTAAFEPDDVVLGGGNAKKLDKLPARSRLGENANAFIGGFRMWPEAAERAAASAAAGTGVKPARRSKAAAKTAASTKSGSASRKKAPAKAASGARKTTKSAAKPAAKRKKAPARRKRAATVEAGNTPE